MRWIKAIPPIAGVAMVLAPTSAAAQDCGRICLYNGEYFSGRARCYIKPLVVDDLRKTWAGFSTRSARVTPGVGCRLRLILFDSKGAKGHGIVVVDENPDLTRNPVRPPNGYGSLTISRFGPKQ